MILLPTLIEKIQIYFYINKLGGKMSPNIPCFQFTEYLEKVEFNNFIRN